MIIGHGIDSVDILRIRGIIGEKPRFAERVLTDSELVIFQKLPEKRQAEFLAGRFACKEAFAKAWGTGIGKLSFKDIEVLHDENGAPIITKSPHKKGRQFVSITHTDTLAIASIILESEANEKY